MRLCLFSSDNSAKPVLIAAAGMECKRSGKRGNNSSVQPIWQALWEYQTDAILNDRDHHCERLAPQTAAVVADPSEIRESIVGMGGRRLYG